MRYDGAMRALQLLIFPFFLLGFFFCPASPFGPFPAGAMGDGPTRNPHHAAMRSFGVWEPETGERFDFSVWYPSSVASSESVNEGWIVDAGKRGRMLPGFHPVILLSHDSASGRFANNDLAAALASGGMVVIVPSHTGDSQNSSDSIYTAGLLRDRPRHLLRALDTVLASPDFAPHVDESRIGLLGVGFGGITVLQLAGALPDFSRLSGYCSGERAADHAGDAFCSPWTRQRLLGLPGQMAALEREGKGETFNPRLDFFSPALIPVPVPPEDAQLFAAAAASAQSDAAWWRRLFGLSGDAGAPAAQPEFPDPANEASDTAASGAQADAAAASASFPLLPDFQGGALFGGTDSGASYVHIALPDSPQFRVTVSEDAAGSMASPDPVPEISPKRVYRRPATVRSIKGIALLAPAGGMLFSPAELGRIKIPVAIVEAGRDTVYPAQRHARPYREHLPSPPRVLPLEGADHFSLFARCSGETMLNLAQACGRLTGKERERLAKERDHFLLSFFQSVLGGAFPSAGPSGYVAAPRE